MELGLERVYLAKQKLDGIIRKTDLIFSPLLNPNSQIYLKAENLQITGSFKVRGAAFKVSQLSADEKKMGVVACSAGNHAQGVALSAQKEKIKCTIFMPSASPLSKIEATKSYGAEVMLVDGVYDDAYTAAKVFQQETGATFVHPFDDPDVIAGQGTIGLEILEQLPQIEAAVLPIGGGGLASGIAFVLKQLSPKCRVYGVQAAGAGSMANSIAQKKILSLDKVSTFADGIAVKRPGDLTYDMCSQYLDKVITVTDDEIAAAILALVEKQKMIAEGAGAVAVAAVMHNKLPIRGKKTVCLVSGGNIDINILGRVINRGLLVSGRVSDINIKLINKAGQVRGITVILAQHGANIINLHQSQSGKKGTDINECILQISMETRDAQHLADIKAALKKDGYKLVNQ